MVTVMGLFQRVADNVGVCIATVLVAFTVYEWLKDKRVGHRRTLIVMLLCLLTLAIGAVISSHDLWMHGRITQVYSPLLRNLAWIFIAIEVRRTRGDVHATLIASQYKHVQDALNKQTFENLTTFQDTEKQKEKDDELLKRSRAALKHIQSFEGSRNVVG